MESLGEEQGRNSEAYISSMFMLNCIILHDINCFKVSTESEYFWTR